MKRSILYFFLVILGALVLRVTIDNIYKKVRDKKRADSIVRYMCLFLFMIYIGCVLYITVFSRTVMYRRPYLDPFWKLREAIVINNNSITIRLSVLNNTMLNIIMLMPLGIFIPLVFEKHRNHGMFTMCLGCMFSTFIELTQYFTWRGAFETQDILFNTIGCLIGFLIYLTLLKDATDKSEDNVIEGLDCADTVD